MTETFILFKFLVFRCQFQGARYSGDPYPGSPLPAQNACAFRGCGACCVDIIHQKHLVASDFLGTGDGEGSAQVLTALVAGQPDLRVGGAGANQKVSRNAESIRARHGFQGSARDQFGLIKSTLTPFRFEERYRNQEDRFRRELGLQLSKSIGKHTAEDIRSRANAVVLQQVNEFAQPFVIAAVSDGALKGAIELAASRAPA